ncbi:uncharacterized protein V6R79_023282 [Siganus canaliculatus]
MFHYDPTSKTMRKAAKTERKFQPEEPEENIPMPIIYVFALVLAYLVYRLTSPFRHPNPPQLQQQQQQQQQPQPNINSGASAVVNTPQPAPNITQLPIKAVKPAQEQPAKPTDNQQPQAAQTDDTESDNEEQLDVEGRSPATNTDAQDPKNTKSHLCQPERKPAKMNTETKPTASEASQAEVKPVDVNTSSVGDETEVSQPQVDEPQALRDDIVSSVTAFRDQQSESADDSSMPIYADFSREGGATESHPAENQPSHGDAQKLKDDTARTPVQESLSPQEDL